MQNKLWEVLKQVILRKLHNLVPRDPSKSVNQTIIPSALQLKRDKDQCQALGSTVSFLQSYWFLLQVEEREKSV